MADNLMQGADSADDSAHAIFAVIADRCPYHAIDPETTCPPRDDGYRCGHYAGHSGNHELFTAGGDVILFAGGWEAPTTDEEKASLVAEGIRQKRRAIAAENLAKENEQELRGVVDRVRSVLRDAREDGASVVTVRSVRAALEGRPPGAEAAEQYLRAFMDAAAGHTEAIDYGWLADDLLQTLIDSGEITSAQNKS